MGIGHHQHYVDLASGILIMLTILFWVVMTPLLLYLILVALLVVIAKWFKK